MNKPTLAATTLAVAAAAGTGSIASPSRDGWWYRQLRKPPYQPPGAAFPLVWTTLYGDIAYTSAAAIDRLVHHAAIIEIDRESVRAEEAKKRNESRKKKEGSE